MKLKGTCLLLAMATSSFGQETREAAASTSRAGSALAPASSSFGMGIMSASDSDEYRADDDRCGSTPWAATTLSWDELLVDARGLNFGPWGTWDSNPRRTGYEFNWARSGATASSMIGFGQHTGLAAQVSAGRVQYAVLAIGANDVDSGTAVFAGTYDGTWTQEQIDAKRSQMLDKISLAVDTVLGAGLSGMVIEDIANWMNAFDAQLSYPDPAGRQRFADFLNAVNADIAALAAARGVAFATHAAVESYIAARLNDSGDLVLDGEVIELDLKGCDPHRARINDQTGHGGTVIEGLIANIMVIGPLNQRYGLGIVPFTDNEILVGAGIRQGTEDTTPPAVSLTAPAPGATVSGTASVSANASDNVGVAGVQFQLDGQNLGGEDTQAPYEVAWDTTASTNGPHTLGAVARDASGLTTTSVPATVAVSNTPPDTTPPSVALTFPAPGATVSESTTVSANASDNVGVVGVRFQLDGANLGLEVTAPPYAVAWNTTTSTDGSHTLTAIARDAADLVTTSAPVVVTVSNTPPDTTPPSISLTTPAPGSVVSGTSTAVAATASDNVGVVGVQFRLDGVNLGGEFTSAPYLVTWNTTSSANGSHTLTAVARDAAGLTATSAPVVVTVSNTPPDTTPPSVSLTAPAPGSIVSGTSTTVSATASDNVGVVGVQFQLDGVNLGGEVLAAPYAVAWNTTASANGSHTLTAIARDAAGFSAASAPVVVTVSNTPPDTTPPSVSVTAPAAGSTVSGTSTTVSATASDDVGVAGVQFRLDGVNLGGEDTTPPYAVTWNTTTSANGSHSLTAVARDAVGLTTTSAVVTVTVSNPPPPASAALDDEFDGVALDPSWQVVNPQMVAAAAVSGGAFLFQPAGNTVWFKADKGPFYYKSVTGNFKVTASVRVRKASDPSAYVGTGGCKYAGLMVRSATGDTTSSQNYVSSMLGNSCQAAFDNEYKSTKNNASSVAHRAVSNSDGEIRICRVAKIVYLLHRTAANPTWTLGKSWTRSDLPTALQVGMTAFAYKTAANDIQGQFDYVRFAPAPAYADCTAN